MRNLFELNRFRVVNADVVRHWGSVGDDTCGFFVVPSPIDGKEMKVIASCGCGWEHVSVSRMNRPPNWREMEAIKSMFFGDDTVMQLHVPRSDHVNDHPNCLHLWRPTEVEIPRPSSWMVGGCSQSEAIAAYDAAVADGAPP